jgi:preprotein translocase subunit YajC
MNMPARYINQFSNKNVNNKPTEMILLDIANGWKTAIMIVAMIAVFYFFLIKPQSDRTKKEAAYRDSLKAGDRLVTAGGIHVTFVSRDGAYAVVEAAPGVRMKVQLATLQPIPERKK